ncbi:DNA-directed DNA polymerase [Trypanosoma melophagium]|uniref:DNA-directed DNA polymerase n=1 Tax=Trypanosoma melophagium TaxID=715481 RepID=UPI003519E7AC|nr:DNA-directed DNA polymerase [Trypanosoma melophagium]
MQPKQSHYAHHHFHHHLQHQNYIPVTLTHIRPAEENVNTSSVSSSSSNLQKWMAFGLNKDVISGSLSTIQLPASSSTSILSTSGGGGGAVVIVEEEEEAGFGRQVYNMEEDDKDNERRKKSESDEMDSSICRQLIALSSRVGQAREEENCMAARREKRGKNSGPSINANTSNNTNNHTTNSTNTNNTTGSSGGNSSSRSNNTRNKKRSISSGKKHNRESDSELEEKSLAKRGAATTKRRKTIEEEEGENKTSLAEKKKKQSNRKASTTAASKRQLKGPSPQNLFSMPSDTSTDSRHASLAVPFKEIDDNNKNESNNLFNDIQSALNDPNRIQAPTLFVAFVTHEGDTNFSISANSNGKVHFVRGVNPEMSHLKVQSFILRWKDEVLIIPSTQGLILLVRVLEELPGVEIVTFNAPSLLLLLLSYRQGKLFTSCISDIRLMAWMLQTSEGSDAFTDYDVLLQSSQQQIGLSAGFRNVVGCTLKQIICHRVYYMVPLYRSLYGQLGTLGLLPAFLKQEKRISILCASMKLNGFTVNMSEVAGFKLRCASKMEEFQAAAQKLLPSMPDFNLQNLDDCRVAIYEVLRLGIHLTHTESDGSSSCAVAVTKSGKLSTSEETLKLLAPHHEFPHILIAYRKAAKLLQTYTVGMMETAIPLVNDEGEFTDRCITDGTNTNTIDANMTGDSSIKWVKLHPNFIQEGTDTGRLSCVEPNLQNLPRPRVIDNDDIRVSHEADMASFRRCFAAPAGCTLLSVDYEQIELRVLAHLSADAALVDALTNATDIHRAIAETLFRKSPVSGDERTLAKRAVFGTLYGAGPRTLAAQMGVPLERAMRVAAQFRAAFPHVAEFHRRVIADCRANGGVRTLSGRRRRLADIDDRVMSRRAGAERQAFNTVVQGSAADVVKLGMLAVEREVLQPYVGEVKLLAQIHDELVLVIPTHLLQRVVPLVAHCMAHAVSLLVPLRVTAKVGRSLGEMEEWTVDHDLGIRQVS